MRIAVVVLCASLATSAIAAELTGRQNPGRGRGADPQPTTVTRLNKASSFIGAPVRTLENEKLGTIKDVVVDFRSGNVPYVVVDANELLDQDESLIAVPARLLQPNASQRGFTLHAESERIERLRTFNAGKYPPFRSAAESRASLYRPQQSRDRGPASSQDRSARSADYLILEEDPAWVYYEWHVVAPDPQQSGSARGGATRGESGSSSNKRIRPERAGNPAENYSSDVERYSSQWDDQTQRSEVNQQPAIRRSGATRPREQRNGSSLQSFLGYITDIDFSNRTFTVRGENGAETFKLGENAALFLAGQENARFNQLSEHQRVRVKYRRENGSNVATQVIESENAETE